MCESLEMAIPSRFFGECICHLFVFASNMPKSDQDVLCYLLCGQSCIQFQEQVEVRRLRVLTGAKVVTLVELQRMLAPTGKDVGNLTFHLGSHSVIPFTTYSESVATIHCVFGPSDGASLFLFLISFALSV